MTYKKVRRGGGNDKSTEVCVEPEFQAVWSKDIENEIWTIKI